MWRCPNCGYEDRFTASQHTYDRILVTMLPDGDYKVDDVLEVLDHRWDMVRCLHCQHEVAAGAASAAYALAHRLVQQAPGDSFDPLAHRCAFCGLFQDAVGQTLDEFLNVISHAMRYQCNTCTQLWAYHLINHPHENSLRATPCSGVT